VALPAATPLSAISEFIAEGTALLDYALRTNLETCRRVGIAFAQSAKW